VPFADGDLIHRQDVNPVKIRLAVVVFQILFVDVLDRFPVQLKVPGDIGNRHQLAQLMDLGGQPPSHPQIRVKKLQILDADTLAMATQQLAVLAAQPDLRAGQVQVPNRALSPAVDAGSLLAANMTDGLEPLVGPHIDNRFCGRGVHGLFGNFDSTKGEIR
jgi:hypothetical protein